MKKRTLKKIAMFSLVFSLASTSIALASTIAAYQNDHKAQISFNTNSSFGSYFNGGEGTTASPYEISTVSQLQNLERLVKLGIFDTNHYFTLVNNIDCSGVTLSPIGTENNPFNSNFDGNGYTLSNVSVSSQGFDDVGFFGYVGGGGIVRNILFTDVNITSNGPTKTVTNPLEQRFTDAMLADNGTKDLALTFNNPTANATSNISLNVPKGKTITDSYGKTYDVVYRSNDRSIMNDDGTLINQNTSLGEDTFYITMDALISDTYYEAATNDMQFRTFVVQRFQIYVDRSSTGIMTFNKNKSVNGTNTAVALPTMYNTFTTYADSFINAHDYVENSSTNGATVISPVHTVYVGLVCGHVDGAINYVGVQTGTITANTVDQVSYSTLIGKASEDTNLLENKSKTYFEDLDLTELISGMNLVNKTYNATDDNKTINGGNWYYNTAITDFNNGTGLRYIEGYPDLSGISQSDVFRIYGNTSATAKDVIVPTEEHDGSLNYNVDPTPNVPGLTFNQDLSVDINTASTSTGFLGRTYPRRYGFTIKNGFFFWASMRSDEVNAFISIIQQLFGEDSKFDFEIEFQYSVDDCSVALNNDTYFRVDENKMSISHQRSLFDSVDRHNVASEANTENVIKRHSVCSSSDESKRLQTHIFEITSDSTKGWRTNTSLLKTPVIFIGLDNSATSGTATNVNIHRVKFSMTSANGNAMTNLEDVDFVNSASSVTYSRTSNEWNSGSWDNWPQYSGTYIYFFMVRSNSSTVSIDDEDVATGIRYTVVRNADSIFTRDPDVDVTYYLTSNEYMIPSDSNNIADIRAG